MWAIRTAGLWIVLLCSLSACAQLLPEVDPVQLAEDTRIWLGDTPVTVPAVAISTFTDQGDLVVPKSPSDALRIFVGVYGTFGEMSKSREICPLLKRRWSQSICKSAYSPLNQSLPDSFTLLTPAGLLALRNAYLGGVDQTMFDVVSTINFNNDRPGRACSTPNVKGDTFCWAGYQLSNGLFVLWEGQPEDDVKSAEMIQLFVENALGAGENFDLLERAAIARRRSNALCMNGQPYEPEVMQRLAAFVGEVHCDAP